MSNAALRSSKYLEQARLRIRFKFQSKFPAALAQTQSFNTDVPRSQADSPLEQARLRIRNRFLTKFPTSSTLASGKERKQAANGDKSRSSLEDARFPTTLNTAIQTKDGKTFTNYLRATPLTDPSTTKMTHFLGVLQDAGNANIGTNA